ncbi:MAG: Histidyl-tRNA synthetase, partial [uncultured Solirubrobacteraceae bacterium]
VQAPSPARHVRRAGRRGARTHRARARRGRHARGGRLRAHRDAGLRDDGALRARRGGVHRRRAEGDVHARRGVRGVADPPPGGHRAGLPRLPRARHAQGAAAREALVPVELLPPRAP